MKEDLLVLTTLRPKDSRKRKNVKPPHSLQRDVFLIPTEVCSIIDRECVRPTSSNNGGPGGIDERILHVG